MSVRLRPVMMFDAVVSSQLAIMCQKQKDVVRPSGNREPKTTSRALMDGR